MIKTGNMEVEDSYVLASKQWTDFQNNRYASTCSCSTCLTKTL